MAVNTLLITTASHLKYFKIPLRNVFLGGIQQKHGLFLLEPGITAHFCTRNDPLSRDLMSLKRLNARKRPFHS